MILAKDGRKVILTDPIHIEAFKESGWIEEKSVSKIPEPKVEAEPEMEPKPTAGKRGRPSKKREE